MGDSDLWAGRVAFVSGGVSGLGFGIARAFAEKGMKLALSYRNEDYRSKARICRSAAGWRG